MVVTDFFPVEVWTMKGVIRYQVLFVIRLATGEVSVAGISAECHGHWMEQISRNLTDGFDGFLTSSEFSIHDRDPLFAAGFKRILQQEGIKSIRLPRRSPNLNAFAERFVRSIKEERLDQMVFFSEKYLRYAITEYVAHYHGERNHRGLEGQIIQPQFRDEGAGEVECRERLGGMLNFYYREAA